MLQHVGRVPAGVHLARDHGGPIGAQAEAHPPLTVGRPEKPSGRPGRPISWPLRLAGGRIPLAPLPMPCRPRGAERSSESGGSWPDRRRTRRRGRRRARSGPGLLEECRGRRPGGATTTRAFGRRRNECRAGPPAGCRGRRRGAAGVSGGARPPYLTVSVLGFLIWSGAGNSVSPLGRWWSGRRRRAAAAGA